MKQAVTLFFIINNIIGNGFWLISCENNAFNNEELINIDDLKSMLSNQKATTTSSMVKNEDKLIVNEEKDINKTTTDFFKKIIKNYDLSDINITQEVPEKVDCFGLDSIAWIRWMFDLKPLPSDEILVEFYFSSRKQRKRVQVIGGEQFGLEWVNYNPKNPTIVIVHGFLSFSGASWVINMTNAFLDWKDVNVITVDWSRGGNTWKYWKAVANTRTVGTDLAKFLNQLMNATQTRMQDFHFIGHSLGAHICSYAATKLKGVKRITGLDPAQPCFITNDLNMLLDKTDADFVDIIHTNARGLSKFGLGVPNPRGHQDFYPNGGMKQPGCHTGQVSLISKYLPISPGKIERAICNHGRAYLLFTESLKKNACSLIGHPWNLKYSGVNSSIHSTCYAESCPKLGIRASESSARGSFYVITTSREPFCERVPIKIELRSFLLSDIEDEEKYESTVKPTTKTESNWWPF